MKTSSAKAKGRRLQQWFRDLLIEKLGVHPEDIESRSMGAGGEDLIMARAARLNFPYSIECKNVEKLNIWSALEQSEKHKGPDGAYPIVGFKRNRSKLYVALELEHFLKLVR